jgi:hypothetical protein
MHEMNNLSIDEYARFKATMRVMDDRRYVCSECLCKYDKRPDKESMLKKYRDINGCFDDNRASAYRYDDLVFSTCPGNFFDRSALWLMEGYKQYQLGNLPFEGALADQPAKVMECFELVDNYNHLKMVEEEKKVSRGNERRHSSKR